MNAADADTGLVMRLDTPLPAEAIADRPNLLFLSGHCHGGADGDPVGLDLAADGHATPAMAHSMPRPDITPTAGPSAYRSGFWGIVPLPAVERARPVVLELEATFEDGSRRRLPLGSIELLPGPERVGDGGRKRRATGSDRDLHGDLRAPDRPARAPARLDPRADEHRLGLRDQRRRLLAGDARGDRAPGRRRPALRPLQRRPRRRGFFHNFERALRLAPPEAEFVAFADQDDRWDAQKLDVLLDRIGGATVAYSDARIVTPSGELLSETYWSQRRNNNSNFVSLLLANTVSGSAALFRREVVERALPFPYASGGLFHDHWLATVGLALGRIAYVDRPLYDYVQHDAALLGHERAQAWANGARSLPVRLRHFREDPGYFYEHWRTTYFQEYCRVSLMARLLLERCGPELSPQRRTALERLVRAERSPGSVAWLAGRQLRGAAGGSETLGAEGRLLRALAWKHLLAAQPDEERALRRWLPRRGAFPVDRLSPTAPPPARAAAAAPAD